MKTNVFRLLPRPWIGLCHTHSTLTLARNTGTYTKHTFFIFYFFRSKEALHLDLKGLKQSKSDAGGGGGGGGEIQIK